MSDSSNRHRSGSTRRELLALVGGGASAALAGCLGDGGDDNGGDDNGGDDDGAVDDGADDGGDPSGGELNLINATMSTLDPIASTDTASSGVINQMTETLVHFENGETELVNVLADGYELSDDLLTYTFDLKDAQYHDGQDLTADDFVYSWRRLAESEHSSRQNFLLGHEFLTVPHETETETVENEDGEEEEIEVVAPDTLGVEAIDESTFEVNMEVPNANALGIMAYGAFGAIPEGLVDDIEGYDGEMSQEEMATEGPIGTGPFEFDTWEPDQQARVVRFDDYHGEVANIDAVHWQIIEDDEAAYTYAMERSADVFGIPTAQYDPDKVDVEETDDQGRDHGTYGPLENDDTANYVAVSDLSVYYVAFNAQNVPRAVRQAVAYVTDHEELINEVFKGRGVEAWTFTPPGIWPGGADAYENFVENYPYSPNETDRDGAREVLEEAGYTEDDPFEVTLTTYESQVFQEFGRLTRDKLSGLGLELELEEAPFSTLIERGNNGDLEFYSLGWIWSWPEADYGHFGFDPENTRTGEPMRTGETNGYYLDWWAEDSDAVEKAEQAWQQVEDNPEPEEGQDERNEGYQMMEEAIWEDAIMVPLYHGLTERFWYDHVDIEPPGPMGGYRQRNNRVTLDEE